jgi:hypothetical protein
MYLPSHSVQRLKTFIDKHADSLDTHYSEDMVNTVIDELDTLAETSESLNKIEVLLPALDTQ